MKTIISTAFILVLFSCQNQENQTNESSDSTTASVEPTIEMLKENTMMLYRQDPEFVYYEQNASELVNVNIYGLYGIHQVCEELAGNIKNNEEVVDAVSKLVEIVDNELASITAMGQKKQKESFYLIYAHLSDQLKEIDFSSENKSQALLNLAAVENMLVQNTINEKNFTPYKFNKYEPIVFAETSTIKFNDSIPLHVGMFAYDTTEASHVKYTTNPKDLDNNNNITDVRASHFYLKGEKKGNHILYGKFAVKTRQGEERWLNWEYSYTVK